MNKKKILKKLNLIFLKLISFFIGFVIGNLFGTIIIFLRSNFICDSFTLLIFIIFFEIINFIIYSKECNFLLINKTKLKPFQKLLIVFKNIQIGILFGFFIDAFKVGS